MAYSHLRLALTTLVVFSALAGCKPKVGDKCSGAGFPTCSAPGTAMICDNGVVMALPCRGPKACTSSTTAVQCDNSVAEVGDACDQPADVACALDHKSVLECQNKKFALSEPCKGARACEVTGELISCDNDVADVGDACRTVGDYACLSTKSMVLKCVDHKFQNSNSCRGKDGCRVFELPEEKKTDFVCDDALAEEHDPCDTEGEAACSMDKTAIYVCKSQQFIKEHDCAGGCSFDPKGEKFTCTESAAEKVSPVAKATPTTQAAAKPVAAAKVPAAKVATKATKPPPPSAKKAGH